MADYLISPSAKRDLEEASQYGDATFGVGQTDRYFEGLDRAFELIAEFPLLARERREFDPPVRIHRHERHYIVYAIQPDHVRILRVLRDEVDLGRHLHQIS